ncbi:MAG: sensor domain-containing diguanylate cyclase [Candidatus Omnitrophica bacterium]|nr:sensor domain-containing diguanylate cyclase [Candidatus Omnitrophota bacterium]
MILTAIWYRKAVSQEEYEYEARLEIMDGKNRILREKFEGLRLAEEDMGTREAATVGLYEVTRDMSAHLKFNDIFKVFSSFLKSNFSFKKCELLVLEKDEGSSNHLGKVYGVWKEDPMLGSERVVDYEKMIRYFLARPERICIDNIRGSIDTEEIGLGDPTTKSFLGVPLSSDGKPVAILIIENLAADELEKFGILAIQLSLEIKKVFLYETVEKMAVTDSLTGHYVRRYFAERLDEELGRSARQGLKFSFLMLDIDDFKKINDTYGHLVGDVVLKDIGHIIKDDIREIDLACRYGGEEFAVMLPETSKEGAFIVAERIRKRVEEHVS